MKTKLLAQLALSVLLICGGASITYATPILVGSATWISEGIQHDYSLFLDYAVTWDDANMWVNTNLSEYYLATITSAAEQDFINSSIFANTTDEYWLGGYQNPSNTFPPGSADSNWAWVTGEAWSYTNWSPGEPSDVFGGIEFGVEQYLGGNWGGWKMWNDEGNVGNISGFVAEKTSPIPEPITMVLFGTGLAGLVGRRLFRKK